MYEFGSLVNMLPEASNLFHCRKLNYLRTRGLNDIFLALTGLTGGHKYVIKPSTLALTLDECLLPPLVYHQGDDHLQLMPIC